MSYSCTDFTDDTLDALGVEVPEESYDSPSDQADLALEEIERLQRIEKETRHALAKFNDTADALAFAERIAVILEQVMVPAAL
jgi:hypothetical protein